MTIPRPQSKQPMPDNAERVFQGILFDVYQWQQQQFDGSYKTFEKLKRIDIVTVFPVLPDGRILLTREQQPGMTPYISTAGGHLDPGEDPLTAAQRELLEETGCAASEYTLWKSIQPAINVDWAVYVFIAHNVTQQTDIAYDAGEIIQPYAVTFDEFLHIIFNKQFVKQEIAIDICEALVYPEKYTELKKLFRIQ